MSLAVVYAGSILLTNLVTNAAAAALMFPIMAGMVTALDTAWQPFVAVLMLGCSYAFVNPASYQTSLMVMKPGGHKSFDFVRVGAPLTVVVGAVAIPLPVLLHKRQAAGIFPGRGVVPRRRGHDDVSDY